ncbi:hypothetical protein PIB30_107152 [Stylosanthes scabra]|uniref:Uncharacterized protein n=1 Tax=Stylosanthes scabra TaxID=79078 RepID=A0ABU6ZYK0_9FABA|nr:hypothetical protein [Stylosanthes scabra]
MESPPQDHPMADWFLSNEDFNRYQSLFAPRKVIPPRYMEPHFLIKNDFPLLQECLVRQNLVEHVKIKEVFYPDLIAAVYSTLQINFSHDELEITFKLGHETHSIDSSELISLWKLDFSGDELRVDTTHDARGYSREAACNMFNIPYDLPKPTVGHLNIEHRLMHYLIVYVMVPRLHNYSLILEEDLETMWRIASGHKINWTTLIASHMQRNMSGKVTKGLPYAMLWTTIFKHLNIDLNNARKKELEYNHCIDNHVLNHMKREINQPQVNVEEGVQEDQVMQEEHTQPPQAGPSMQDMMEVLLRIEQNQTSMANRLDKIEKNQAKLLRKIRRVEAYTFDEDEAEDVDDDFWS